MQKKKKKKIGGKKGKWDRCVLLFPSWSFHKVYFEWIDSPSPSLVSLGRGWRVKRSFQGLQNRRVSLLNLKKLSTETTCDFQFWLYLLNLFVHFNVVLYMNKFKCHTIYIHYHVASLQPHCFFVLGDRIILYRHDIFLLLWLS